jgi:hypothetical protein
VASSDLVRHLVQGQMMLISKNCSGHSFGDDARGPGNYSACWSEKSLPGGSKKVFTLAQSLFFDESKFCNGGVVEYNQHA